MKICILSTYPPAKCGIAEYAGELVQALRNRNIKVRVIAVDQGVERLSYPSTVKYVVNRDDMKDYLEAAKRVNHMGVDAVLIQHEYGIFGGEWGSYLLEFMERVRAPIVTTLHTTVPPFDEVMGEVTRQILELSDMITVMSQGSLKVLDRYYGVNGRYKIRVVPHGVRSIPTEGRRLIRAELGISDRFVMLTIGFLGPNKGIEYAIKALPKIQRYVDNILYLIVGIVHPKSKVFYGDSYYKKLVRLTTRLGVEDKVLFINKFPDKEEYVRYIVASDVMVLPYIDKMQVSSGTLSYALSYGKAVVATPFVYARDLLSGGRGILCKFKDPDSIAEAVIRLAKDPGLKAEIETKALECGLKLRWEVVVEDFLGVFMDVVLRKLIGGVAHVAPTYAQVS
ncbi:MAG: glycosyltransferase [Thermoprotei archaeon]|nr:glycosyltransferase [Thermoprotei archaeon]